MGCLKLAYYEKETPLKVVQGDFLSEKKSFAVEYRFGFNGQEHDRELNPSITTAEFWQYDGRLGRRWNVDPKYKFHLSNYSVFGLNPNLNIDPHGDDFYKNNVTGEVQEHPAGWKKSLTETEKAKWDNIGRYKATDWKGSPYYNDFSRFYTLARILEFDQGLPGGSDGGNSGYMSQTEIRVAKATLIIAGGVAVTMTTCGAGTSNYAVFMGTMSGSLAIGGGTIKLGLALNGTPEELADKIPTGIVDATVGITLEAIVDNKKVQKQVRFATQIVDGALDLRGVFKNIESTPEFADRSFTVVNITIEMKEKATQVKQGLNK